MSFADWVAFGKEMFVVIVIFVHILVVLYGLWRGQDEAQLQKEEKK
jgi:hypothetical protein